MTAFGRSSRHADLRWWMHAFQANLAALAVTSLYWFGLPDGFPAPLLRAAYVGSKTLFVLSLMAGVAVFAGHRSAAWWRHGRVLGLAAGAGLLAGLFATTIERVGVLQASLIAWGLGAAAWACFREPSGALRWLGIGLGVRAALGLLQGLAYGGTALPAAFDPTLVAKAKLWLASHSSFDTGAEWLVVLGCVVAIARRSEEALRRSHAELEAANRALSESLHVDALTGLANRRALAAMGAAGPGGATLLFFDLDGFKRVNDQLGHDVGDACLIRFARALERHFPEARLRLRYAGDEFLVVDEAVPEAVLRQRIEALRAELAEARPPVPAMGVSVGLYRFGGGDAATQADALRLADQAMYRDKAARLGALASDAG